MSDFLTTVAGLVAYDGGPFQGFQWQETVPTVQGGLEAALAGCTGQAARVVGAGRTDAGVHASGQVVKAQVCWKHGIQALWRAWNAHLSDSIVVRELHRVPTHFHPRYHALSRTYQYHVLAQASGHRCLGWPLAAGTSWYVPGYLDVDRMNRAGATLLGTHDFGGFGRAPDGGHRVRTLLAARWQDDGPVTDDWHAAGLRALTFTVTANAFLYRMVRRLTATLVRVGLHEWGLEDIRRIMATCDTSASPPPAPARGLVLCQVAYAQPLSEMWERNQE